MSCNSFCATFPFRPSLFVLFLATLLMGSCKGKQQAEDVSSAFVQNDMEEEEEDDLFNPADTLVYDTTDAPLTEAVDESFTDFIYTFLHRRGFQQQRADYPVQVTDAQGEVLEVLTSGRAVSQAIELPEYDYVVLLMNSHDDPYDYLSRELTHAELHFADLLTDNWSTYDFDLQSEGWKFTGIHRDVEVKNTAFWHFYRQFATDTVFQEQHLANEIFLSLSSAEDEEEQIEGNIDATQWAMFAPELPQGQLLLLDLGDDTEEYSGIRFAKCSIASSLMEVLTFVKDENSWRLTSYEE